MLLAFGILPSPGFLPPSPPAEQATHALSSSRNAASLYSSRRTVETWRGVASCPIAADHVVSRPLLRFGGAFDGWTGKGLPARSAPNSYATTSMQSFFAGESKNGASDSGDAVAP